MISGTFVKNVPAVPVTLNWLKRAEESLFVLDTGFSGDLQITPETATELGLSKINAANVQLANGNIVSLPATFAIALMEGKAERVQILISKGLSFAGIGFLTKFGFTAIVDCENKTVALTAPEH